MGQNNFLHHGAKIRSEPYVVGHCEFGSNKSTKGMMEWAKPWEYYRVEVLYVRCAMGVRLSLGDTPSYLTSENITSVRIVDASNNSRKRARKPCDGPGSTQCHVVSLLPASTPVTLLPTRGEWREHRVSTGSSVKRRS
jgi:hypothetical protein